MLYLDYSPLLCVFKRVYILVISDGVNLPMFVHHAFTPSIGSTL